MGRRTTTHRFGNIWPILSAVVGLSTDVMAQVNCEAEPLVMQFGNVTVRPGIQSYGVSMSLGVQKFAFRLMPDIDQIFIVQTAKNCTDVTNPLTCRVNPEYTESRHGGLYDIRTGTALRTYTGPTQSDVLRQEKFASFDANETINIPDPQAEGSTPQSSGVVTFQNFPFEFVPWIRIHFAALGLSPYSAFVKELYNIGRIPSRTWGFFPGWVGTTPSTDQYGSLVLGGYDKSLVSGKFIEYEIDGSWRGKNICGMRIDVTEVRVKNAESGVETAISFAGETLRPCIDLTISHIQLPARVFFRLLNRIGMVDSEDVADYDLKDWAGYPIAIPDRPGFDMYSLIYEDVRRNLSLEIPQHQFVTDIRDWQPQGRVFNETRRKGLEIEVVEDTREPLRWGNKMLAGAYLRFNGENGTFALAPGINRVVAESSRQPTPVRGRACASPPQDQNRSSPYPSRPGPPIAAIVGGIVGGVILAALIAVVVWWRLCRLRKLPDLPHGDPGPYEVLGKEVPVLPVEVDGTPLAHLDHNVVKTPNAHGGHMHIGFVLETSANLSHR
ncbi:hypothetical protein TWF281_004799 [Arthrobotrys megalospora]